MRFAGTVLLSVLLSLLSLLSAPLAAEPPAAHYTIGTGSRGATFYPLASALCQHISQAKLGFTCEAVESSGAQYNLQALQRGEFDFALSQISLQYQAWKGDAPFTAKHKSLRSLVLLHREVFVLAVRPGLQVSGLADLGGKRLSIGNQGSGSRVVTEHLLQFLAPRESEYILHAASSAELPSLLCNGEVDAAIYSTGHPNSLYREMIESCGVTLVDLWDDSIEEFVASQWQLEPASISAGTYPGVTRDVTGFGVRVMLSAHRQVSPIHAREILRVLHEDSASLATLAPIYQSMQIGGGSIKFAAPWHAGAALYLESR